MTNEPGEHATLRETFARDGFVVLPDWLDVAADLAPLQRELGMLIEHAARACGARHSVPADPAEFDRGYLELVGAHPEVQPLVYDMAKNLVSFQRLIVNERLAGLFRALRETELAGTAPGSNGVRIDRPGEPLVDPSGSGEADMASGAYGALRLPDEATIPERYELCAPESKPGDLFAFDFLTLHASGPNVGARARWTLQIRYFNFSDSYGASIRWMGGLKHGTTLAGANALLAEARAAALGR